MNNIENYFQQLEWPYEQHDEQTWVSGYKGEAYTFSFYVRIDEYWLYVYTPFPANVKVDTRENVLEHLMRLNHRINMAKFVLDDDGEIGLAVEVPNENLSIALFEDALQAVCIYMDENYAELVNLATNPNAVSSLLLARTTQE